MSAISVKFFSHNRKAKCAPNPKYPDGIDVDLSDGAKVACFTELPYPAECCGVLFVSCGECGLTVAVTTAGRPDDPRSVKLGCKS
jgi:hypothetical protein